MISFPLRLLATLLHPHHQSKSHSIKLQHLLSAASPVYNQSLSVFACPTFLLPDTKHNHRLLKPKINPTSWFLPVNNQSPPMFVCPTYPPPGTHHPNPDIVKSPVHSSQGRAFVSQFSQQQLFPYIMLNLARSVFLLVVKIKQSISQSGQVKIKVKINPKIAFAILLSTFQDWFLRFFVCLLINWANCESSKQCPIYIQERHCSALLKMINYQMYSSINII